VTEAHGDVSMADPDGQDRLSVVFDDLSKLSLIQVCLEDNPQLARIAAEQVARLDRGQDVTAGFNSAI
jgi:hypothetical protein